MRLWHRIRTLARNLTHKDRIEHDLDEELRAYQQLLEDEKIAAGADPRTARREALLAIEGREQLKEEVRDVRLGVTLDAIRADLRQSFRGLRRNASLTVMGTLMLGLGMGASTVVFSIFHTALVKALPFRDSERLVQMAETRLDRGFDRASFTEANFWDVRAQSQSFEEVAAYHFDEANMTGEGSAEKVSASRVSAGFFRTLGVSPVLGRDFAYDEVRDPLHNSVVLLGNRFWKSRFAGDPQVLGKTIRLNDRPYTVIGVLPPGEPYLNDQLFVPFGYRANANRGSFEFDVIGRLKPGVTFDAARADLQHVADDIIRNYPREGKGTGFRIDPSTNWIAGDSTRRALWVLLGAVTFLLLIACLNIANMLLARGTARQREIAVRTALGAGRIRLVRFIMMEAMLLSAFGALFGLGIAYASLRIIQVLEIRGVPRLAEVGLNPWVLAFAIGIALLTGIFSGLAPALQRPGHAIAFSLRSGDRQTGSRSQGRLRAFLVTCEVAFSFVLLVGSGLLIRSFSQLMNVDRGFQTEKRLVFSVSMPDSYYEKGRGKQFLDTFLQRLRAIPDVVAVGSVSHRPVEGGDPGMGIDSDFRTVPSGQRAVPWASWRVVTPGYLKAIGLPLLRGRFFDEGDKQVWSNRGEKPPVRRVIISERLAKLLFPNQDAVGKHAALWKGQSNMDAEVVGVVADSRERGLTNRPTLTVYLPYGPTALASEFVIHTRSNPMSFIGTVRGIVNELDPNLPIATVRTFEEVVNRSVAPQRFQTTLLAIFSGLALLLATTGIYGVLSYSISRKTSEIGLRVALGASSGSILSMAIKEGMKPALLGMVLGALGASALSTYFVTLLYGIKPFDPTTYIAVAVLLMATALLACYVPGRRAMRTDPAIALRIE